MEVLDPPEVTADPTAWRRIGEEVREQLDYRPGRFLRRRLVRPKYVRAGDPLAKPVIAPLPPSLQDRCTATPALIAEVVTARYAHHLPYYRQSEIFSRQGVNLHRKTLCDWSLLASDWLAAIHREIRSEHHASHYLQLDETPIDYLEPGHGKTRTGYLWTSNIPGGSVLYHWQPGRDQSGITGLLGADTPFPRIIQCDGFSAYPSWARGKEHITLMGCHAHVRRKFYEAKDQSPKLVGWILRQLGHLYRIEKHLRQGRAGPALRDAIRASESRPIHQQLKRLFDLLARRRSILPQSNLGKAIRYALNQWDHLVTYLRDGRIEIDNNLVENAIRPTKLGAKNWLFIGREAAGDKAAILYTVVENCRRLGIDPKDYLTDVLTRLPGMQNHEVAALTPSNWLKTQRTVATRRAA
ncbi:IS66 family transposase [Luteolibacter ambystomatis]|uniref:IS66 family transposase n=1 Tax=Luteolibacter ambystomatis TaxID=2824561 RepID=UPI001CF7833F